MMGRRQQSSVQMAAMWVLVLVLTMQMLMKSEVASAQIFTVSENLEIVLPSADVKMRGIMEHRWEHRWDVRWTHRHLVLSRKSNRMCHHGRCELQRDGSLRFSRVQVEDAGNYSLEVFYENGTRLMKREFVLRVEAADTSSSVGVSISCLVLFLLLVFIIIFILKRRRRRRMKKTNTSGQMEENVCVSMQSSHGNKGRDDGEKKQEKEEESVYVPCHPIGSTKTPITKQMSAEGDDIYV